MSSLGMAPFFERMAAGESHDEMSEAAEFLATHPDSRRRAGAARAAQRTGRSALTATEWSAVRGLCKVEESENPVDRLKRRFGISDDAARPDKSDQVRPDGQ
jgi:predicted Zn-dependent protease